MPRIRVLVVDDAVVMRKMISEALGSDPLIEVVGTAANGHIALQKIPQVNPDILTLDIEMPEMDGLQTVRELRKTYRDLPVIMFSTLTLKGAETTLDALAAGATDYVTKPSNVGNIAEGLERLKNELIPKIKIHCRHISPPPATSGSTGAALTGANTTAQPARFIAKPAPATGKAAPPAVLAIGCSTGGPNALAEVFKAITQPLPVPVVIVQHMPPLFTQMLAERLGKNSPLHFHEGQEGQLVEPGHVYIAPGGRHMEVRREGLQVRLRLHDGPPENSCRPAVDVLFRSVASVYGGSTVALIMTGMGQDGLHGCTVLRELGATILDQDEATSVVWGMPGYVAQAGLAHQILPLPEIAGALVRLLPTPRSYPPANFLFPVSLPTADFEFVTTFARRTAAIIIEPGKDYFVESRLTSLATHHTGGNIPEFIGLLRKTPASDPLHGKVLDALTTNETFFFRDIAPFDALRESILPALITQRAAQRSLAFWSAASSTGQEAYSLAILLREHFPQLSDWNLQIIGTDLSPTVLSQARAGRYNEFEINRGLSPALVQKYFTREGAFWTANAELRRMIDFRPMNLIEPWPRLPVFDVVLMRNVMIYFDVPTKQAILRNIRAILQPQGSLLLGSAETTINLDPAWQSVGHGRATVYQPIGVA